jgi:hypothetical protein
MAQQFMDVWLVTLLWPRNSFQFFFQSEITICCISLCLEEKLTLPCKL